MVPDHGPASLCGSALPKAASRDGERPPPNAERPPDGRPLPLAPGATPAPVGAQTSSIRTISVASLLRGPSLRIRVYPPGRDE